MATMSTQCQRCLLYYEEDPNHPGFAAPHECPADQTSDRAGNEERLREAMEADCTCGHRHDDDDMDGHARWCEGQAAARGFRAALAAAPTQSGAEGPADARDHHKNDACGLGTRLDADPRHALGVLRERHANIEGPDPQAPDRRQRMCANDRQTWPCDTVEAIDIAAAALRSGAEVAAAPGLSEAATLLATFVTEGRIEHRTFPANERCRELMPTDGTCDCGLREARALAARLTAKP